MGDNVAGAGTITRTRPLCEYPKWARYNGSGDVNAAASFSCVPYEDAPPTQRATHLGTVLGTDQSAPTAPTRGKASPMPSAGGRPALEGAGRARPLDDHALRADLRQCLRFGRPPVRPGSNNKYDATIGSTLGQTLGSEDCLFLNIWRPAGAATNLPVIVWVHGGSNITGYTADPLYDGANLARTANAVVVR